MNQQPPGGAAPRAWVVLRSGPLAGASYALPEGATTIGRDVANAIVIRGPEAATVSLRHLEITRGPGGFHLRDLDSTNGTLIDGEPVTDCALGGPASIRLGPQGPELDFVLEEPAPMEPALDQTLSVTLEAVAPSRSGPEPPGGAGADAVLAAAVARAREARSTGLGGGTMTIMREALDHAVRVTSRRLRGAVAVLLAALLAISGLGAWKITDLRREKRAIDQRIQEIETRLQTIAENPEQADRLIAELAAYQGEARRLEGSLLYRVGVRQEDDFLTREIRMLMAEFGAEVYSVPPDFVERVAHYIQRYQGEDRPLIARALREAAPKLEVMRKVLESEQLPPDLAYIPLVESALRHDQTSPAGAAGLWQFTAPTARAYGLRVDDEVDERLDLHKATQAGCRYLRELILDFGAGSSVMLALAAYNVGPSKVKQAVRTVQDPIKQRNFWYLYRRRALPAETREYVPKVMAAMIIGRNPSRFGF